jgi:hypothetical protein
VGEIARAVEREVAAQAGEQAVKLLVQRLELRLELLAQVPADEDRIVRMVVLAPVCVVAEDLEEQRLHEVGVLGLRPEEPRQMV